MKTGEFEVRDARNKNWYWQDDEYLNGYAKLCGIHATGVYSSLCRHANKNQTCFPSKKLIAEELSISERSVYSAIKKLEEWNIIVREDQGRKKDGSFKNSFYSLPHRDYWKSKPQANCAVGRKQHSPQANDDTHRRHQVPNKETHREGNTYKERDVSFDKFWEVYPKKELKKKSKEIWINKKLDTHLTEILTFIDLAQKTDRWQKGYIKQPPAFLNNECWNDELEGYNDKKQKVGFKILKAKANKYDNV